MPQPWTSLTRRRLLAAGFGALARPAGARGRGELVFSVRRWQGEYESHDVPGGVAHTPVTAALYAVRDDGSGLREIPTPGGDCNAPVFSPDGAWVYFQSDVSGAPHLYRCRPDGSRRAQITSPETLGRPWTSAYGLQMTRDGQVLFTVYDGSSGRVALANPDGSGVRVLAPDFGYLYMAAISPKGDAVVASGPATGYRLVALPLNGGPPRVLTPDHPQSFTPQFFPDGKSILFFRRDGDAYRVNLDGGAPHRLTEGNGYVEFRLGPQDRHGSSDPPQLSPDGRHVACIALRDGTPNLCVVDAGGGPVRQVTFRKSPCGRPRWSPDGKNLSFVSFEGRYPQLFVSPAAGGNAKQVTRLDGAVYLTNWRPA